MLLIASGLALTAGALFGFNVHIHRKGLDGADGMTGAFLSVSAMALSFWLVAPFVIDWRWFAQPGTVIFALAGLFFPAMGQTLQIQSVQRVGPALTSVLGSFVPVFATIPAVFLLGESFGLQSAIALLLMVGGLVLSAIPARGLHRSWPYWALAVPLGAAAVRGFAQPAVKQGLVTVPSPFFAALITATVSMGVLGLLQVWRNRRKGAIVASRPALQWFALSGVINGLGIFALNAALGLGAVTVVAPVAATTPLWTLLFGAVIFRREALTLRHLLITALVFAGAVLLVLH